MLKKHEGTENTTEIETFVEFCRVFDFLNKKKNLNTSVVVLDFEHITYAIPIFVAHWVRRSAGSQRRRGYVTELSGVSMVMAGKKQC